MYRLYVSTNSKNADGSNYFVAVNKDYSDEEAAKELDRFAQMPSDMFYPLLLPEGGQVLLSKKDILVFQLVKITEQQELQEEQGDSLPKESEGSLPQ